MKKPFKRKIYLINPEFQVSFIKYILSLLVVVTAVFYGAISLLFWTFAEKGRKLGLNPEHIFFSFLKEQRDTMDLIFLGTTILTALVIIGFGLFLSNRVAGPIHRLKLFLADYKTNKSGTPVKFREKDYFQDLAESVNEALELK